jgi:hypothetical protein
LLARERYLEAVEEIFERGRRAIKRTSRTSPYLSISEQCPEWQRKETP